MLETAFHRSDLFHAANSPFVLEADFTAQMKTPMTGKVIVHWGARDRWRIEVELGAFAMIETRNGEQNLILRNVPFTPIRVKDLLLLLRLDIHQRELSARNLKKHRQNGQEVDCIEYGKDDSLHACVDPSTGDLLSAETTWAEGKLHADFSGFTEFHGLHIPQRMLLQTNAGNVVSANITRLALEPFDDKLLELPKDAIVRRECEGEKPATTIKMAQIEWPRNGSIGDVQTSVTVLQDGSVGDVEILGSASPEMNRAIVSAIRKSKYQPAMCGSDPVTSELEVDVQFRR